MKPLLITIDGPAGAGKTTVSRMLASRLGYRYIDTGALYRGIAYAASKSGIGPGDTMAIEKLCAAVDLQLLDNDGELRIILKDIDITDQIRTPEITMLASALSALPIVRDCLLGLQRKFGEKGGAVFEGRDMGTVVFPDADVKFFLDADVRTRALRRYRELTGVPDQTPESVEADIRRRDANDSKRSVAPLKPAGDAVKIDSTALSLEAVVSEMLVHVNKKMEKA